MLRRNRLMAKAAIDRLDLAGRVHLEAQITDARAATVDIERYRQISLERFRDALAWRRYLFAYLGDMAGKRLLDVGCGYSMTPVMFALAGTEVVANDVAPLALELVRRVARMHDVENRIECYCGPAEQLPYPSQSFDRIFGGAALHHLQIDAAGRELSRVLRPGGRGGFQDPLGHNRLLEFARDNLNYANKHREKGTDRPLKTGDLQTFGQHFATCAWRGFDLLAMAARLRPGAVRLRRRLEAADHAIVSRLPALQRYARFVITLVSN